LLGHGQNDGVKKSAKSGFPGTHATRLHCAGRLKTWLAGTWRKAHSVVVAPLGSGKKFGKTMGSKKSAKKRKKWLSGNACHTVALYWEAEKMACWDMKKGP